MPVAEDGMVLESLATYAFSFEKYEEYSEAFETLPGSLRARGLGGSSNPSSQQASMNVFRMRSFIAFAEGLEASESAYPPLDDGAFFGRPLYDKRSS
jgi:hypothetical protein